MRPCTLRPWTGRPSFVDHTLSTRLEAGFAAQLEAFARAVAERLPARGAAVAEIAGGRAVFIAPRVSVSRRRPPPRLRTRACGGAGARLHPAGTQALLEACIE